MNHLMRSSGFSLITVMISAGIISMLALASLQIVENNVRSTDYATETSDFRVAIENISRIVSQRATCRGAFRNPDESAIALYAPAEILTPDQKLGSIVRRFPSGVLQTILKEDSRFGSIYIEEIEFKASIDNSGTPVASKLNFPIAGRTTHYIDLIVTAKKSSGLGAKTVSNSRSPISIEIVTLDSSHEVIDCYPREVKWISPLDHGYQVDGGGVVGDFFFCDTGNSCLTPDEICRDAGFEYSLTRCLRDDINLRYEGSLSIVRTPAAPNIFYIMCSFYSTGSLTGGFSSITDTTTIACY